MPKFILEKNGIEIIKLNKNIRKLISDDIKEDIHKKLKLGNSVNFERISKHINHLDNITFNNLFGSVANRYLSYKVTKEINSYINYFKLNRNFKKVFLHQMTPLDLKENQELKKTIIVSIIG